MDCKMRWTAWHIFLLAGHRLSLYCCGALFLDGLRMKRSAFGCDVGASEEKTTLNMVMPTEIAACSSLHATNFLHRLQMQHAHGRCNRQDILPHSTGPSQVEGFAKRLCYLHAMLLMQHRRSPICNTSVYMHVYTP